MSGFGKISASVLLLIGFTLAGCGGGGGSDGDDGNPPVTKAEGAYAVNHADGSGHLMLILENDELWSVYRVPPDPPTNRPEDVLHGGFWQGRGSSSSDTFHVAELRDFDFINRAAWSISLNGTYLPGESLELTATPIPPDPPPGEPVTFKVTSSAVVGYQYDTPASAAAVAGHWAGFYAQSEWGSIDVSAQGEISGVANDNNGAYSCLFTGSIRPRPSGKNVYDVTTTTDAASCGGSNTLNGIAFILAPTPTTRELVMLMSDPSVPYGTSFVGVR